jgi:hypothetical protein
VEHEPDATALIAADLHEVIAPAEAAELQGRVLAAFQGGVLGGEPGEGVVEFRIPDTLNAGRQPEPGLGPGARSAGPADRDLILEPGPDRRQLSLEVV